MILQEKHRIALSKILTKHIEAYKPTAPEKIYNIFREFC